MGRRGRSKQLLDDLKEKRGYWKLKDGTLDRILQRTRRGYRFVVRQAAERINSLIASFLVHIILINIDFDYVKFARNNFNDSHHNLVSNYCYAIKCLIENQKRQWFITYQPNRKLKKDVMQWWTCLRTYRACVLKNRASSSKIQCRHVLELPHTASLHHSTTGVVKVTLMQFHY